MGIDFRLLCAGSMKKIFWLGALAAAVVSAALWLATRSAILPVWVSGDIAVRAAPVKVQKRSVSLRVGGKLSAKTFDVRSQLAGRVAEVRFKVGDFVPPGAVVAIVESGQLAQTLSDLETAFSAAREALKAKQERLDAAQKELERSQDLLRQNLIARNDAELAAAAMETARADAQLAEAHAAQQEAMLAQARALQRFTRVTTEAGGVVAVRYVTAGAMIGESVPILGIANRTLLHMKSAIPQEFADAIKVGTIVQILANREGPQTLSGNVVAVERSENETERSAVIEISVNVQDGALEPDTPVEAVIHFEREAIWLPRVATVSENGQGYVYKLTGKRFQRQEISLGVTQGEDVEVVSGLKDGDWVIVERVNLLKSAARGHVEKLAN